MSDIAQQTRGNLRLYKHFKASSKTRSKAKQLEEMTVTATQEMQLRNNKHMRQFLNLRLSNRICINLHKMFTNLNR